MLSILLYTLLVVYLIGFFFFLCLGFAFSNYFEASRRQFKNPIKHYAYLFFGAFIWFILIFIKNK
jgi:hypothetical protein